MLFYIGLHQPSDAAYFPRCMISVNRLRRRRGPFCVGEWIMDSGAFTELKLHGRYREVPEEYAKRVRRWWSNGRLAAAVSQDYMCEPFILDKTGLSVETHQRLTIDRYDALHALCYPMVYIMPVLQGFEPAEYVRHLVDYGPRLADGAWVGVGSVCKRNERPEEVLAVMGAIKAKRPDLKLHGFGLKLTALKDERIRLLLHSADSMAWSFSARKQGRSGNRRSEARRFLAKIGV